MRLSWRGGKDHISRENLRLARFSSRCYPVVIMFKTKRQQRERKLRKWRDADWANLPPFLAPCVGFSYAGQSRSESERDDRKLAADLARITSDPDERIELISEWLENAENDSDFRAKLDRHLRMPTESEEAEKHLSDNWLFQVATLGLLVVGAIVAIVALYR